MESVNKKIDRKYPERDISKNPKMNADKAKKNGVGHDTGKKPVNVKDMPEIVPARTGILG